MISSTALTVLTQTIADNKKKTIVALVAGLLTGTMFISDGAYLVKDIQNIAETVKVYTETTKVVTNTLKQLGLSEIDLNNINNYLKKFNDSFETHRKNIDELMIANGGFMGTGINGSVSSDNGKYSTADKDLAAIIPAMTDDNGKISWNAKNVAKMAYQGAIMTNNKDVLEAYKKISTELEDANKELQDLMEENAKLGTDSKTGTLAAQQLNNQIKAVQARIQTYETMMKSLQGQNDIIRSQAEAQEKTNEILVNRAQVNAEKAYMKDVENRLNASDDSTPNVNVFTAY